MYLAVVVADVGDGDFSPVVTVHGTSLDAEHYLAKLAVGYLVDPDAFKGSMDAKVRVELPRLYLAGEYVKAVDLFFSGNKLGVTMSVSGVSVSPLTVAYTEAEVANFVREGSLLNCSECGGVYVRNGDGTTNHVLPVDDVPDHGDDLDYEKDEDHVAYS